MSNEAPNINEGLYKKAPACVRPFSSLPYPRVEGSFTFTFTWAHARCDILRVESALSCKCFVRDS